MEAKVIPTCTICGVEIDKEDDYVCKLCRTKLMQIHSDTFNKEKEIQKVIQEMPKTARKLFYKSTCNSCGKIVYKSHNVEMNACSECILKSFIKKYYEDKE